MGTSYNPKIVTDGLVLNLDPANVKSYPAGQDPFVNNVSLMLSMDGANNSTTFIDSSQNALAITAVADAKISTAQSKFGGSAAYFDGTGDYLTVASNAVNAFGLGDFTIECWVNFSALPGTNQFMGIANVMTSPSSATFTMWWFALFNDAGTNRLRLGRHGNGDVFAYVNWTPSLNTWYHVAATRSSSSVIRLFIDGVSQSVTTSGSNWANDFSATTILSVGYVATALTFNGYIDDFRLTRAARYTASFTPPTAPLSLPGVVTDLTKNRSIGTLKNGPTYSGGNLVFNGTNHYITSPTSTLFNFGTGDFTIEMWVYPTSVKTFSLLDFRINETNPNGNAFVIGTSASNFWVVYQNGNQITGPTVVANQWVQVVVNRVGTAVKMFLNGVQVGSTWTTSNTFTDGAFVLGTDYPLNARFFQGNISSVKVYKAKGFTNNEILQNFNATKGRFGL
jgi:hypothetical protein